MSLELANVGVQIGKATLLDRVSLYLKPGELVALVGPNGAGKSTLLKVASGELEPTSGSARLDGRSLGEMGRLAAARRRAVLPQSSSVAFEYLTHEVVLLGRTVWDDPVESSRIADEALTLVGLGDIAGRRYSTLSGGEQQRTHFARVLAQIWEQAQGCVLLLDEPTSSLDLCHQRDVLGVARDLTRRGASVLAVLHDLNLAAFYADRVALLCGGRLIVTGTPAQVLTRARIRNAYNVDCLITPHPDPEQDIPLVVPLFREGGTA